MPKVVDHDERREALARAVWSVVARAGVEGATVRAVAAEAGWSMGALRYYFATQDGLLTFALEAMLRRVPQRLARHLAAAEKPAAERRAAEKPAADERGAELAQRLLEELLPLDSERLGEVLVWLAFLARARVDAGLAALRLTGWAGERFVCRYAVAAVSGCPPPERPDDPLPTAALEAHAESLHIFVDGLTLQGATFPEQVPPAQQRRLLRERLAELRSDLPGGEETWTRP
jgi:AcrR family transcriptional regulator